MMTALKSNQKEDSMLDKSKYASQLTMPDDIVGKLVDSAAAYVRVCAADPHVNNADADIEGACFAILIIAASNGIALPKDVEQRLIGFAEDKEWRDAKLDLIAEGVEQALGYPKDLAS
jgi:hypothetical protein